MTRAKYRSEIKRLRGEYLTTLEHTLCSMERGGLVTSSIRNSKRCWKAIPCTAEAWDRSLHLTEEIADRAELIRQQILENQVKYAVDWMTSERGEWTVKQLAKACEISVELAQMIVDSLGYDQGWEAEREPGDSPLDQYD